MDTGISQTQKASVWDSMETTKLPADAPVEQIAISKARSMIGKLVNRVHVDKERIVLEKGGMPVAALIDIEEFKKFMAFQETAGSK